MGIVTFAFIAFYHYRRESSMSHFRYFPREKLVLRRFSILFPFPSLLYSTLYSSADIRIMLILYTLCLSRYNILYLLIMMTNYLYAIYYIILINHVITLYLINLKFKMDKKKIEFLKKKNLSLLYTIVYVPCKLEGVSWCNHIYYNIL